MADSPTSSIFLRPLGSPLTVAMAGLAMASLVQSGLDLHWVALAQTHDVGLILISVPFVLQLAACVFSYLARDGATGAAVGVLSVSWLAEGLVHISSAPGSRSGALGLMLLASAGMLLLSGTAISLAKPAIAAVITLAALRFAVAGVYLLGSPSSWQTASGIIGLAVVATAGYCVLAFELEGQRHQPVLPTFRTGRGAMAIRADAATAVDGLVHEAGVRQTT
jgi:uncharacterized protein